MSADPLLAQKRALRTALASQIADPALGFRLAGHVLEQPPPPGAVVAGFWPTGREIDLRPLLLALAGRDHPIVLPRTPARGLPLAFHRWRPGAPLVAGRLGILEPPACAERLQPDVLLVPLAAFDAGMRRLGRGAGYYDRTLAALRQERRIIAIGVGFACQQVDRVPAGPHDALLDAVATEHGLLRP